MDDRPWLRSYPPNVPRSLQPYPRRSLFSLLEESAARAPGAPAVWFLGKRLTYGRLLDEAERFSAGLASLGVERGDRVALVLPNCPQYVIAFFAVQRLGAIAVGTNPLYTERELAHQFRDAGARVAVVLDQFWPGVDAVRAETGLEAVVATRIADYLPFPTNALAPVKFRREARTEGRPWPPVPRDADVRWWRDMMDGSAPGVPVAEVDPLEDPAILSYTGGTTGASKGAALTHFNLVSNLLQIRAWTQGKDARAEGVMCVLPMFHLYGLLAANFGVCLGGELVLVPRFDLSMVRKAIAKRRPSWFPGVPRMYIAINDDPASRPKDFSSVRTCFSAAAPLPQAVAERFEALTGGNLVEGYGLTEASPTVCGNPIEGPRKPGVGMPIPDTVCRIVDPDDWTREMPGGEVGELAVAGPQVMQGYWNHPAETDDVIRTDADGVRWLLTGDMATMDEDGYFTIVDRKKDLIIVSGFNVYPSDVEEVLYRHPEVARVCVVGVPDPVTGEAVKAFVVLKEGGSATAEEIRDWCRDPRHGLTGYRVPSRIEFRDSLPETLIGKVLRRVLQEEDRRAAPAAG